MKSSGSRVTKSLVKLTQLSLCKVVDNSLLLIKQEPWISLFVDNRKLFATLNEHVVDII